MKNVNTHRAPTTDYFRMAKYYDKVRPTPANAMLNKIIKYGGINNSSYVVDIGCGTGRYPINIPVNPYLFCALEPSIEICSNKLRKRTSPNAEHGFAETDKREAILLDKTLYYLGVCGD